MERELFNKEQIPYICTPLTGKTTDEISSELTNIVSKQPDMLEWRVDFFSDIDKTDKVLATLKEIHSLSNGLPLLFTIRSHKEGGQEISLVENQVVDLLCEVCKSDFVDLIDFEAANPLEHIQRVKKATMQHRKKLVLSHHKFDTTPSKSDIIKQLAKMSHFGADVAKVAFMPNTHEDVMALLEATKETNELLDIELITISMGDIGVMSRVLGWLYGSVLTFAVGEKSSAPGQISIEALQGMIDLIKKENSFEKIISK
ncbi:3-dehydroquinate dehydratase [Anaerobacillus arseniciselenatis]|uniref:3-dehydroquinate dehydratase n=1 Tax=Anaerobacillus arseniciselenatis TaxID=85682 RepID=A0A1S2LRM5_9BACI|nr:type I 3-dehydroquinate dehydratase [Anaerobacillus arseniciselenatis]OIJ14035.1 3-dehydroquinate dehydratase [Anaerobacillus arseniciselenatis]